MKVMIAGAGNVGRSIARELIGNGHDVVLIEREPRAFKQESVPGRPLAARRRLRAQHRSRRPGCRTARSSIAATGDDKVNLVVSLLAKTEYGVPRVVARVNHPKNEWLFNEAWGVDVAVSTPRLLSALVEEAVTVGDLVRLLSFRHGEANLVEVTLPRTPSCAGHRVGSIAWPPDVALVAILRDAPRDGAQPRRPARGRRRAAVRHRTGPGGGAARRARRPPVAAGAPISGRGRARTAG